MKEKIKQLIRYHHIKAWYEKYERILMPATLVLGVIIDSITFASIDIYYSFLLLGIYLAIASLALLFLNAYEADRISKRFAVIRYLRLVMPLIIQFTFGALLSGTFVFYLFSGSVFVSWPFILLMVVLMVSNDVFRHYYLRPGVQLPVFFFILFSCISIVLPFVFHSIDVRFFILGGLVSLLLGYLYVRLLTRIVPTLRPRRPGFMAAILVVLVAVNSLYFLNLIPPIPLVLREAAVAHDIKNGGSGYTLQVEKQPWWAPVAQRQVFHKDPLSRVFVYTAIFAPKALNTTIVHHWQQYDEVSKEWITKDRLPFVITGGKQSGFRGFSRKTTVPAGEWRVDVETERGQVLGRVRFTVVAINEKPPLLTVTK